MCVKVLDSRYMLMLLAVGLLWFGTAQAVAQTVEESTETADATNPPRYIVELVEASELSQEQLDLMRADGLGWGEIRIAVRLAEEIAAAGGGALTFDKALAEVLAALDAGEGFGEIANEHDLKVGQLVGNGNQKKGTSPGDGLEAHQGNEAGQTKRVTERKPGFLARLGRFLGFGKKEQRNELLMPTDIEPTGKTEMVQKVERIPKTERVEKVERAERPSRPEKPERPAKPEKPEKPERGPTR